MTERQSLMQTHVLPLTTVRCERFLPWPGEVLVRTGQKVDPSDVVARADQPRPHQVVDIVKKLRISRPDAHKRFVHEGPDVSVRPGAETVRMSTNA